MADTSTPGLVIPAETQAKFSTLLDLIKGSESMNDEERQYWINILPIMTTEQVKNLEDILLNEKRQLEAIDKKYTQEAERMGEPEMLAKTDEERRKRREERERKESKHEEEEDKKTDDILKQIENN